LSRRWRNGEERAETAEALAELIIAEELKLGRWQEADLKTGPKGYSVKVALAARLRAEATMTVRWIAERLAMGTRGYLNHPCIAGGSWAESIQYQELTPFPSFDGLTCTTWITLADRDKALRLGEVGPKTRVWVFGDSGSGQPCVGAL
jgi:hypothetical protein